MLPLFSTLLIHPNIIPRPISRRMVNWTHVLGTYLPLLLTMGIFVLVGLVIWQVIHEIVEQAGDSSVTLSLDTVYLVLAAVRDLFTRVFDQIVHLRREALFSPAVETTAVVLVVMAWFLRMDNPIYLLSFATFKAPDSWKVSQAEIVEMMRRQGCFTEDSINFMKRLLERSGTGQSTAWPPGIVQCLQDGKKTDRSMEASRKEAETVICDIVENALRKANVKPKEIDVLVINCSLFSPTPSLCAMVISKFGLRGDVQSFNLSGMGCGASLISVGLAKDLLQRRGSGGKALVVSTEIITPNLYHGNERGFLLQNTLFRCGGAAMVLSNKWSDGRRAWYKLLHTVRVQGTTEDAYNCVYETEDGDGERGVRLSKEIVKVAGKCMEKNMTMIGPYVLPLSEQFKVVVSLIVRFITKSLKGMMTGAANEKIAEKIPNIRPYVPDFKRGIDHFCIHAGGRAVIDGRYCLNYIGSC